MADALLLTGQRAVPDKAQHAGFPFKYRTLEAALRALFSAP
jgi:NAD dependent epimerase/dehydratase family enzyme